MRLLPLAMLLILCPALASWGNWPQWRGPDGNRVAPAGDYPVEFGPDQNCRWQVTLEGEGSSTPVAWGEQIYLTEATDGQDVVVSYDLGGNERWRKELGPSRELKNRNATGSNPSIATDGEHVVAYFKSGLLACLDTAGNELWRVNLQDKYGPDTLWWDLGTSPVLTSAGVCIAVMQAGDSYLVTFGLESGDEIWKTARQYERPRESDQAYTTPSIVELAGRQTIVTWGADHLTGHDAKSGELLWQQDGFNPQDKGMWRVIASATVADGVALVPYGRGEHMAALALVGNATPSESKSQPQTMWRKQGFGADVPTPIIAGAKAYCLGDRGEITCLDLQTGEIVWQERLPRAKEDYFASPLLADGKLYCLRQDGTMMVASVADGFELLAENDLGDESVASPVPVADGLLVRTRHQLFSFGKLQGDIE